MSSPSSPERTIKRKDSKAKEENGHFLEVAGSLKGHLGEHFMVPPQRLQNGTERVGGAYRARKAKRERGSKDHCRRASPTAPQRLK